MADDEVDDLRDRIPEAVAGDEQKALVAAVVEELDAVESGEKQKTVSVWDGPVAAFVRALERNPGRMDEVGHALQDRLDLERDEVDRSEVLRLALRLGFREAAPEEFEAVREAALLSALGNTKF